MRISSKIGLAVAILLIAVGTFLFFGRTPEITPEAAIQRTLQDAERGAKNRSARQVMEAISNDFRAGLWDRRRLYIQVVRSMRDGRGTDYDAHLTAPQIFPSPKGDPNERLVISRLSVFEAGSGADIWGTQDLTLVMRKEWRPRLLIFREPYWRIVSVANLPPGIEGSLE